MLCSEKIKDAELEKHRLARSTWKHRELSLAKGCGIGPREERGCRRDIPSRSKSMEKDKEENEK